MDIMEVLQKPITISGSNIDERYFKDNGDGTYTATPLLIHNVARDADKYFHDKAIELDDDGAYHTVKSVEVEDKWTNTIENAKREQQYKDQLAEIDKRSRAWREANPDKCNVMSNINTGGIDEGRYFAGYRPDMKMTFVQAIQAYKALHAFKGDLGKDDDFKATLPRTAEFLKVKYEYEEEFRTLRDSWLKELGVPAESKIKVVEDRVKIADGRSKIMKAITPNAEPLEEYFNGLVEYLTTTTREAYMAKWNEFITFIDGEFLAAFDKAKSLKVSSVIARRPDGTETAKEIAIHTKTTDDMNSEQIIFISKENPTDANYTFTFNAPGDGKFSDLHFGGPIATKADLRTALETAKTMIERINTYKKYVVDIDAVLDAM